MNTNSSQIRARDYITTLAASGRYHFTSAEARNALDVSADAAKLAVNRLARQNLIASPARGFYVIVPPQYQSLGCLPADQFIPALMDQLELAYYAGLLSAAQYHGAAHHRPQEFQILLSKPRRPIQCGKVRVSFMVRKNLCNVPLQSTNTPRGTVQISTPEATAIDLVGYFKQIGGLDQVATILTELAEQIEPEKLVKVAQAAPVTWAQRLGYLLELADAEEKTGALRRYVKATAHETVGLLPGSVERCTTRNRNWKLLINTDVELEF